ncbi:MAG: alkaline phosphatase PhoX [Woeseiaceae bacterium]
MQSLVVAAAAPSVAMPRRGEASPLGPLRPDPDRILDLPEGFSYKIVSRAGDPMSDGMRTPGYHDGMAAFAGENGRVILICNHELGPEDPNESAFGGDINSAPKIVREKIYDAGAGLTPGNGGTTTTIYDPASGGVERQFLSLVGTEYNCAGGATPWGSWLTCEECFRDTGRDGPHYREKRHGYVFEVPAQATELVQPEPITAMGRFEHEAAAVHAPTGIVYLTEDRNDSLFYRYVPDQPGKLLAGGRLQALAIGDKGSVNTGNRPRSRSLEIGEPITTHWIDLDNVDSAKNDLRKRGAAKGAATFVRGEGLCAAGDDFFLTATSGGPVGLGQVFRYRASGFEGTAEEKNAPGSLTLIAESSRSSLLRNADNIAMAPFGDLFVCEDTSSHCGIVGIGPDGVQYAIADNGYSSSELAGLCFSPDGETMFVNIQYPGMTLAVTGPWPVA